MLLLARELHAHRRVDRARQQRRIGGHVVGAVAAIAAGGLHADHVDRGVREAREAREIGAKHVRVLRAGPHGERAALPIGQRARRADGSMHLVRPHIAAQHRLRGTGDGAIDVALLGEHPLGRRVVAQRVLEVAQRRHAGPRLPAHVERTHRGLCLLLALGDDADEVADHDGLHDAGQLRDRRLVHRLQRVADEIARIDAGIRRPHDAAVQHAGHTHVVHEDQLAGGLGGDVDAWDRLADDAVVVGRFQRRLRVDLQLDVAVLQQLGVADAPLRLTAHAHGAVAHVELLDRRLQCRGCLLEQPCARGGRRLAQWHRMDLDRCAGDGRALVGGARGVAEHHVHAGERDIELLGGDLRQRRADAGAEVDVAVQCGDAAVVPHGNEDLRAFGRIARHEGRLAGCGWQRRRRIAHDEQHARRLMKIGPRVRQVGATGGHLVFVGWASAHAGSWWAEAHPTALCTASRISR